MIGGAPRHPVVKPNYHILPDNPFQGRVDFARSAPPNCRGIKGVSRITRWEAESVERTAAYRAAGFFISASGRDSGLLHPIGTSDAKKTSAAVKGAADLATR